MITTKLSALLDSFSSLKEARAFLVEIKPFFSQELPSAKRSLHNIENSIVMKLARSLRAFEIDPSNQENIEVFAMIMEWSDCLDENTLSAILEGEFFTKWMCVLYSWIHQDEVDLMEIVNWIDGWRSMFPPSLLDNQYIVRQFNRGWDIVNDVMDHTSLVDPAVLEKPITYLHVIQNRRIMENEENLRQVSGLIDE